MVIATRSMDAKGALEHILTVILVYDSNVKEALEGLGATDVHDFMDLNESDFKLPFDCRDKNDPSSIVKDVTLPPLTIKKLISLQQWFATQPVLDVALWYGLTADSFNTWRTQQNIARVNPIVVPTTTTITPPAPTVTFRQHIKINVSDYNKLKEDHQWRSFHRHLLATAANHDTLDVLNPSYVPSTELALAFDQKQKFMYNVFTQCILTSKGKVCVRSEETTMNAQAVYKSLLSVYNDNLSASLDAAALRAELTMMKLDDKWRKGFETFLTHWSGKIQELESIEDKLVDEDTKRIWLTNTLLGQKDMDDAVRQAITTELTMSGMSPGGASTHVSWTNFYQVVLSTAKMLDKSKQLKSTTQRQSHRSEQNRSGRGGSGRGRDGARGGAAGRGSGRGGGSNRTNYTKYTGPNMTMLATMIFTRDDWKNKLTEAQKTKLIELKKDKKDSITRPSPSSTSLSVNSTQIQPTAPAAAVPSTIAPGNTIRNLLSNSTARDASNVDGTAPPQISYGGRTYSLNTCAIQYAVSQHDTSTRKGSLIDGGANGGMSGADVRVINQTFEKADITGIADKSVSNLPLCSVAGLIETHRGPIIGIFHQYAHYGKGKTVHSVNQMKHFGIIIHDTPRNLGMGQQCIQTPDGYIIPLSIRNGLPHMDMSPPSDLEMESYPHVMFSSDLPWDPTILDDEYQAEDISIQDSDTSLALYPSSVNDYGELHAYACNAHVLAPTIVVNRHIVRPKQQDFQRLKPHFGFVPVERIQKTIANTSQYARMDNRLPLRKHYKSRFPAANVSRLNETVATDTFFSDVIAHDDGILGHGGTTMLQLYCGCTSLLTAGYPMKTGDEMAGTLQDFIRHHGAPNALFSDNAKAQIGHAVQEILRMYAIKDFQCEPYHQHQNYAERRIQEVKKLSNQLMDRTNTSPHLWLLCVNYSIYLLNRLATASLDWKTPIEAATGQQPDISALLAFRWYEPVYFRAPLKQSFPSSSLERTGRIVGIAEHQGDALTFLVLDDLTDKVVARSELRSALDPNAPNLRAENPQALANFHSDGGEYSAAAKPIMSASDVADINVNPSDLKLPKFTPSELLGLTFLRELDDGNTYRATVARKIIDKEAEDHNHAKFLVEIGEGKFDEIITYNELSNIIEEQQEREINDPDKIWTFASIKDHQGPLRKNHPDYKGSMYNVLVEWDDGSESYEPLDIMIKDDPITLAKYAEENDLLQRPGWKSLNRIVKMKPRLKRMVNQIKLGSKKSKKGPNFQFGIQVPRNVKEAYELDKKNGNTNWADAMKSEVDSLNQFNTFKDKGTIPYLPDYKRIIVHFVFAVKHDLRHKARLVAGGHLTDASIEGTYSGVVSLRSLRIALVAAELNNLEIMVGDVSSAYLEAYTQEKVCFIAGPEFGDLQGHLLVIERALYGLRTSGARWHDRFADTLREMGYFPCKADPDVWMKDCITHYEYVCVYVDDLMVIGKNPKDFLDTLTEKYHYQLKGVGKPSYHLGGDFFRDPDGTLAWGASTYVKKMLINFETMFGAKPKEASSPMVEKDHPELDTTDELDETGIKQYQSLIGALQWLVTLGRFDILLGVTAMSSYRAAPRVGHLECLKRMYGYIKRNPDGAIRFRVKIPDHESQAIPVKYDWSQTVYGDVTEELPPDMPIPKGKVVRITTYKDANLMHDLITGRSMSGVLHFINQTPVQWFSKKQNVVETATYGSEFMVARQATEQVIDLRYTLRMMGIPIDGPAWVFGDNQSVIISSTTPQSCLNKRHNALSYHRVRESIAAAIIYFMHVEGRLNPSDMFTKFLGYSKFWPLIQPLLFWRGETVRSISFAKPISVIIKEIKDNDPHPSELRGVTDEYQSVKVNSSEESNGKDRNPMENEIALPMVPVPRSDSSQKPSYSQNGDWTTVTRKKKPK
jgi:Reverse transcriptase (RNA-dependent DNA polymerase)